MKIIKDEILKNQNKEIYKEYDQQQLIVELSKGERVQITIIDSNNNVLSQKEYVAKYINCHINCQWQDKGIGTKTVV